MPSSVTSFSVTKLRPGLQTMTRASVIRMLRDGSTAPQTHGASLGRHVAIKVLAERLVTDTDVLARFEREARAIGALNHPNVVVVHDVGVEGSTHFVVMELLEGETRRARLTARGLSASLRIGLSSAR